MEEQSTKLIEHMDRDDFVASVRRAEGEADEANASRRTLELWATRLLPYLSANPSLTVAEAIDLYNREHQPPAGT